MGIFRIKKWMIGHFKLSRTYFLVKNTGMKSGFGEKFCDIVRHCLIIHRIYPSHTLENFVREVFVAQIYPVNVLCTPQTIWLLADDTDTRCFRFRMIPTELDISRENCATIRTKLITGMNLAGAPITDEYFLLQSIHHILDLSRYCLTIYQRTNLLKMKLTGILHLKHSRAIS